jgi:FlaA1/EpsC-like NDP-sugar epimerase
MKILIRNKNFWLMLAGDIGLIALSYYLAYLLRFEGQIPEKVLAVFKQTVLMVVAVKVVCFFIFTLYRGMWRYTSIVDFLNVLKAVAVSSVSLVLIFLFLFSFQGFSRAIFVIDFILTLYFIASTRLGIRMVLSMQDADYFAFFKRRNKNAKKLLIIGAGDTGARILREMMENPRVNLTPVGFLDDNPEKRAKSIHGVPVLGHIDKIDKIEVDFDEILITTPSATGAQMERIVAACKRTGKPFKTMPQIGELIDGRVSLKLVRNVSITDIVGREEMRLDHEEIRNYLHGKRIMITGAGGSIGSELVRQISRFKPRAVALLDMGEYNLYQVEIECRERFGGIEIKTYLVDLSNPHTTCRVFEDFRPDVVFHAAAYKHVPMQELNPWEAIQNNIQGTRNAIRCSIDMGVDKFVLVSTDKAVRPTNIMGVSKRICELLSSSMKWNASTRFLAVRFGNVLGSSGSVIPLFQQQIARGGPVTITHPDITRYFMSIPEAAQLILQAGAMGEGGEIFILKMGNPVRIADLAHEVIRLSGFEPGKDIRVVYTGLRPGEKLYEELITEGEGIVPTLHEKIMVLRGTNGSSYEKVSSQIDDLIDVAATFDTAAIKLKLKEIVPEYTPQ